jgi:hypothetical protein
VSVPLSFDAASKLICCLEFKSAFEIALAACSVNGDRRDRRYRLRMAFVRGAARTNLSSSVRWYRETRDEA